MSSGARPGTFGSSQNWQRPQRRCFSLLWALLAGCTGGGAAAAEPGVLSLLLPRDAQDIDPRFVSDPYGLKLSRLVFASLLRIDPQTLDAVPDLAESVVAVSELEYRAQLRPGLKFSDGSTLDSEDVVATYRSLRDPALKARYASTYARISRVEALDPLRVVFHLDQPHASFMTDLELPVLRAEDAQRRIALGVVPPPVGAGPYLLTKRRAGLIELAPNPRWYGGAPRVPRVRMLVVRDDNTRALRLLAGAGDLALNAIPPGLTPLFTPAAGFAIDRAPGISTTYLGINTTSPKLRDVRVRRALAYAIDRAALIATKLAGRAEPALSWIPHGHWAYDPNTPAYARDLPRARRLLAEAGAAGIDLRLRCSSERSRVSIARAVAAMLGEVGLRVRVQPTETATLIADLDRGRFELTLMQSPEVIEPHVLSWFFASDRVPGAGREGGNRWRIADPQLDAALERGRRNLDRAVRWAAYSDVQRIMAEQLPVVPLWHENVVAVRSRRAPELAVGRDGRFSMLAR
jgi:peptide/nickel transport system substrate-binding protein